MQPNSYTYPWALTTIDCAVVNVLLHAYEFTLRI